MIRIKEIKDKCGLIVGWRIYHVIYKDNKYILDFKCQGDSKSALLFCTVYDEIKLLNFFTIKGKKFFRYLFETVTLKDGTEVNFCDWFDFKIHLPDIVNLVFFEYEKLTNAHNAREEKINYIFENWDGVVITNQFAKDNVNSKANKLIDMFDSIEKELSTYHGIPKEAIFEQTQNILSYINKYDEPTWATCDFLFLLDCINGLVRRLDDKYMPSKELQTKYIKDLCSLAQDLLDERLN